MPFWGRNGYTLVFDSTGVARSGGGIALTVVIVGIVVTGAATAISGVADTRRVTVVAAAASRASTGTVALDHAACIDDNAVAG